MWMARATKSLPVAPVSPVIKTCCGLDTSSMRGIHPLCRGCGPRFRDVESGRRIMSAPAVAAHMRRRESSSMFEIKSTNSDAEPSRGLVSRRPSTGSASTRERRRRVACRFAGALRLRGSLAALARAAPSTRPSLRQPLVSAGHVVTPDAMPTRRCLVLRIDVCVGNGRRAG